MHDTQAHPPKLLPCLQGLAKYAFGLGTLQMLLCIAAFTLFALPVGHGVGTEILVRVFHAPQRLAAIRTVDEAIVIAAALSLSSSAFVLQLLAERGELASKFGSATLGILLLQVCWTGVAGAAVGGSCCSALWHCCLAAPTCTSYLSKCPTARLRSETATPLRGVLIAAS